MNSVSRAGVGMYASILMLILQMIGVDADEGMVTEVVIAITTLISFAVWTYGQVDRKDLSFGLFRK